MKNYFLIAVIVSIFSGCTSEEKTAAELLKDPKKADEIYSAILSDNSHLSKFMDKMLADKNCQSLTMMNGALLKMVCMSEKMDSIISHDEKVMENVSGIIIKNMEADSVLCDHTCTRMMENPAIKNYLKEKQK